MISMPIIIIMMAIIKKLRQVETKDALLHAISEQYVEAVEVLLIIFCHYVFDYYHHIVNYYHHDLSKGAS